MKNMNLLKFISLIIIIISIIFLFYYVSNLNFKINSFTNSKILIDLNNNLHLVKFSSKKDSINNTNNIIAYLNIPKIKLYNAPIEYGTSDIVLSKYIGLFEHCNIYNGNICLAAHNRSDTVSYFNKLYMLDIGDEIILRVGDDLKIYRVIFSSEILNDDWKYLQNEFEDYITCITCIENNPTKRLCIKAKKE